MAISIDPNLWLQAVAKATGEGLNFKQWQEQSCGSMWVLAPLAVDRSQEVPETVDDAVVCEAATLER